MRGDLADMRGQLVQVTRARRGLLAFRHTPNLAPTPILSNLKLYHYLRACGGVSPVPDRQRTAGSGIGSPFGLRRCVSLRFEIVRRRPGRVRLKMAPYPLDVVRRHVYGRSREDPGDVPEG